MNRPSYKELWLDERKDRDEQLRWIKDAVNGSAKFYREPPYSYEEELAREIMQLNARIAELEEAQLWIPVSERLPEEGEEVVVAVEGGFVYPDTFDCVSEGIPRFYDAYNVTHWMPLPEPPESA